jgi:8-oxo-dGTP diphosphatase
LVAVVRVCAAIVRDAAILMVRHAHDGRDYWTLPGGGVQPGETPEQAVIRELDEECCVVGTVGARLYEVDARDGTEVCFSVEIPSGATPQLGCDPELPRDAQLLIEVAWRPLAEVADDVQVSRLLAPG